MELQEIRGKLDQVDTKLVELLEERLKLCGQVAQFKLETGKPVFDRERERQKIEAVRGMAHGTFEEQAAEEMFTQLMTISRRLQYHIIRQSGRAVKVGFREVDGLEKKNARVVYQGVEGAYGHEAVLKYFGGDVDAYHVRTFDDVMRAVECGDADYGVLPIENSSAGSVTDSLDLMIQHDNVIVSEIFLPVSHALLGLKEARLEDIRAVYSHPQALMQSSQYLNGHSGWRQISVENTAAAAKKIIEDQDKSEAAVASEAAGKLYGLKVLASSINYNKNNTTRFVVLSKERIYRKDAGKVSLCFELPHKSGTLYNMLGNFIYNNVNMMMIQSRPIPGRSWEYRFFVDIEGNLSDVCIQNAIKGIFEEAANVRILGNY